MIVALKTDHVKGAKMLKGIAASSGVVVAKAYKLEQPVVTVVRKSADVAHEIANFKQALVKTQHDIETIKAKAVGKLSEEELAIFDAHIMVTQDPEFTGQMEEMIKNESVNAEFACQEVSSMFINMFETMDDPYFRERAADIIEKKKDFSYKTDVILKTSWSTVKSMLSEGDASVTEETTLVKEDL